MREILFKAKRADNGEWVTGYYTKSIVNGSVFGYIRESIFGTDIKIMLNTLCQYTGLNDKNGKLIWENDVVKLYDRNIDYKWRAVVLFGNPNCEYTWGWQLKPIGECEANTDILCWIDMEESGAFCEVIGNIFDEGSENIGKGAEEN